MFLVVWEIPKVLSFIYPDFVELVQSSADSLPELEPNITC